MTLRFGVAALGRPTFDVSFAEENLAAAFAALERAGITPIGPRALLFDAAAAKQAIIEIENAEAVDALLIIQVTFTDATMTVEIARNASVPVAIWAIPEPRLGGRLRLNALCGLNLAAHALGKSGLVHNSLYALPDRDGIEEQLWAFATPPAPPIGEATADTTNSSTANGRTPNGRTANGNTTADSAEADRALKAISGSKISVFGVHPAGFDTCSYNESELVKLSGIEVQPYALDTLFDRAKSIDADRVARTRAQIDAALEGTEAVNQQELDRSLRLFCALEDFQQEHNASGLAVRCWPETFTEYGCAACGPMAMMNQKCIPSACEADVYGAFSTILLQELAQEPAWMADLVDLNFDDDTGVFWHCGLAPLSMCDPEFTPEATIHTNRKMPLLHQFPLKPGVFTLARLSQSKNLTRLVIGRGEFIRAPMAFTGTSGVMKFPTSTTHEVFDKIIAEGLEHHYSIAYGDHTGPLKAIGTALNLPTVQLC